MQVDRRMGGAGRRRVLHVITTLEPAGAQTLLLDLAERLDPTRFEIWIAHLRRPTRMPVLATSAPGVQTVDLSRGGRFDPFVVPRLRALIRRERIELVHTHLVHAGIAGKLAAFSEHRPVVTTRHYASEAKSRRWDYRWEDRLTGRAARVIAVSEAVRRHLVDHGIVAEGRIRVVPNAIDLDRFDPKRIALTDRERREPSVPVIGTVGRLAPQKGHDVLLRALARLRATTEARLELVGEGPLGAPLRRLADELGIADSVRFLGSVPPPEIPRMLASWDLFVLPSRWEAFGLAALEAMAMELPVVASAVEGILELVTSEESGLLVPADDPATLAVACRRLLEDPDLGRRLGARAGESVRARHDVNSAVRSVEDLYKEVLG